MIDEADAVFVCAERNGLLRLLSRHWAACHTGTPLPLALVAQTQLHVLLQLRTPRLRAQEAARRDRRRADAKVSAREDACVRSSSAADNMLAPAPAASAAPAAPHPPNPPNPPNAPARDAAARPPSPASALDSRRSLRSSLRRSLGWSSSRDIAADADGAPPPNALHDDAGGAALGGGAAGAASALVPPAPDKLAWKLLCSDPHGLSGCLQLLPAEWQLSFTSAFSKHALSIPLKQLVSVGLVADTRAQRGSDVLRFSSLAAAPAAGAAGVARDAAGAPRDAAHAWLSLCMVDGAGHRFRVLKEEGAERRHERRVLTSLLAALAVQYTRLACTPYHATHPHGATRAHHATLA